jgi:site-specific DNA recombinase
MPTKKPRRTAAGNRRRRRQTGTQPATAPPVLRQAVLYARVSTKDQEREGFSIPAQKELLTTYAADKRFDVVHEFVDVETAKRVGRTSFSAMVKFLKRNKSCKVVLVEKTDRLYRNLKDWVLLDGMDLEIHLAKEGVVLSDDSRSTDKFMHGIRVLMAKNYIDNLSEEVKKGMRQKAQEGHWPNPAPLGYLNRREGGRSTIVRDVEKAPLVAGIFERCAAGMAIKDITKWAKDAGLRGKRGGRIQNSTVHWILRNPVYAGQFWWDGVLYDSKDPKLITMALFERAQDRLDGHHDTRVETHEFPFSGLIRCAHCGYSVIAQIQKKKYIYYYCSQNCRKEKYVRQERIEDMFGQVLRGLHLGDAGMALAREVLLDARRDIKSEAEARMQAARARYDRLTGLIDKAYEDKLEGAIDDEFFQRQRDKWDTERRDLVETMARLNRADRSSMDLAIQVLELGNRAYELYCQASASEKRQLLELLCSNCEMGGGKLRVSLREPWSKQRSLVDAMPKEETLLDESRRACPVWWAILDLNQ